MARLAVENPTESGDAAPDEVSTNADGATGGTPAVQAVLAKYRSAAK